MPAPFVVSLSNHGRADGRKVYGLWSLALERTAIDGEHGTSVAESIVRADKEAVL